MKKVLYLCILILFAVFFANDAKAQTEYDKYIWEVYSPTVPRNDTTQNHISELEGEIEKIVNTNALSPLFMNYSDLENEGYWLYFERGRIINTLAYAYPYVNQNLKDKIKEYVQDNVQNGQEAFWISRFKGKNEGHERRYHGEAYSGSPSIPSNVPTLHVLYGLWLYGKNSGDWQTISENWNQIKSFYQNNKNTHIFYGQISGHIAMARMAKQLNDISMQNTAIQDARSQLSAGNNLNTIESRVQGSFYNRFYSSRYQTFFPGQPWMLLNISPEIGRYLNDNQQLKNQLLNRIDEFSGRYSQKHWWLYMASFNTRWTGDESRGVTPELIGIMFPAEKWLRQASSQTLSNYMKSVPNGVGDSYFIEALVKTIESYGQECWDNLQTSTNECTNPSPTIPPHGEDRPGDANNDKKVDGQDYVYWVSNYGKTGMGGAAIGDFNFDGFVDGKDYTVWVLNYDLVKPSL